MLHIHANHRSRTLSCKQGLCAVHWNLWASPFGFLPRPQCTSLDEILNKWLACDLIGWWTIETDRREENSGQSHAAALMKHVNFSYRSDVVPESLWGSTAVKTQWWVAVWCETRPHRGGTMALQVALVRTGHAQVKATRWQVHIKSTITGPDM